MVSRWEKRLSRLDRKGLVLHSVLIFAEDIASSFPKRKTLRHFLEAHLEAFALKLEVERRPNGHYLHHAHLILPLTLQSLYFLAGIGAKPEPQTFGKISLQEPVLPEIQGAPLQPPFISEVHVRYNAQHSELGWTPLARYLSKPSGLENGLPSVLEKGVASRGQKSKSSEAYVNATVTVQKRPKSLLEIARDKWKNLVPDDVRGPHSYRGLFGVENGKEGNKRDKKD